MTGLLGTVASGAARVGGVAVRLVQTVADPSAARPGGAGGPASGWLVVTVLREPSDVDTTALPQPLADLGDRVEVRVRPAPGDRGAELAARLRDRDTSGSKARRLTGTDAQAELRSALRRAKQLLEVGEVLAVDPAPHGRRTATPGGEVLEGATRTAPGAGVL